MHVPVLYGTNIPTARGSYAFSRVQDTLNPQPQDHMIDIACIYAFVA